MSGPLLATAREFTWPTAPDLAVAPNFERFDGIDEPPLDHPAGQQDGQRVGIDYGHGPRPGQKNQPTGQVYTPGPLSGVVGVLGGQPLPVGDRIHRPDGVVTLVHTPSIQFRLGVGQAYQGIEQTVALSEITNNPPQPGDLSAIIAGQG